MNYPLNAFKTVVASRAPSGSLLLYRDIWALKVDAVEIRGQEIGQILMLTGHNAGAVAVAPDVEAITVAEDFDWMVFADDLATTRLAEQLPAVRIAAEGPLLYGHAWGERLELKANTLAGRHVEDAGDNYFIHDFSVWLVDKTKQQVGGKPLFQVFSPARAPR